MCKEKLMRANNKIVEFNFIKAVSVIGIVAFHFAVETGRLDMLPGKYPLGGVFVTIFFMVSGALLYYNYNEPENIKLFYYKRWKSVMPAFYVAFGCLYLLQVVQNRSFFYNGRPASLLLTLIGFDGYLNDIIPNYYLLGEWFLGAIIILYAVYPFLARILNKREIPAVLIIVAAYAASFFSDIPYINGFKSIFSC
ncbi:MAG TPA: acyltransferase, partial [Candidatus Alectryocaccobium stercorigallinarum]|nr:acyltransferase [Candidatus Alectryocaccobium stercorigallinarum]